MRVRPLLALILLAAVGCTSRPTAGGQDIVATPLFMPPAPPPNRLGELELVAAFELGSGDRAFGGISAMRRDGERLLLLSDRSTLFVVDWPDPAPDRAVVLPVRAKRALTDARGRALDAEALVLDPRGDMLIGDETEGRIHAFAPDATMARDRPIRLPQVFAAAGSANLGLETLVRMPDGALLAIVEGEAEDGLHATALLDEAGTGILAYRGSAGFQVTDADVAGEWLLVLERRLSLLGGWQSRIMAVPLDRVRAGGSEPLSGRELAALGGPELGENYEGLAAWAGTDGSIALLVVADNNFSHFQRTQLLELRWRP